jgi:hypothetical protein
MSPYIKGFGRASGLFFGWLACVLSGCRKKLLVSIEIYRGLVRVMVPFMLSIFCSFLDLLCSNFVIVRQAVKIK